MQDAHDSDAAGYYTPSPMLLATEPDPRTMARIARRASSRRSSHRHDQELPVSTPAVADVQMRDNDAFESTSAMQKVSIHSSEF